MGNEPRKYTGTEKPNPPLRSWPDQKNIRMDLLKEQIADLDRRISWLERLLAETNRPQKKQS